MLRIILLTSLSFILILVSCSPYRNITFSKSEAYQKEQVAENISGYDIIVHGKDSNFILKNPTIENEVLKGNLEYLPKEQTPTMVIDKKQEVPDADKNDLHVYVNPQTALSAGQTVNIEDASVDRTEMYGKDNNGAAGVGLTIFLVILGALVLGIVLIVAAIANSITGSTSGGSDSGGSDSGGSDSGGSDSGCYVATMAYGSYDAPQVLVLRQFRDRFLQKFGAGRAFIRWYYANSPGFVAKHRSKKWLHSSLRFFLNIFVALLKPIFSK